MLRNTPSQTSSIRQASALNQESKLSVVPHGRGISRITKVLIILLILSIAGFIWAFINYREYKSKVVHLSTSEGQQELVKQETAALVAKVKRLIVLPEDEEPTVATVLDAEGLSKNQPFYKGAHNGDRVLIYVKAQKAIIYDPNRDVLINVGPVFIEGRNNASASAPAAAPASSPAGE